MNPQFVFTKPELFSKYLKHLENTGVLDYSTRVLGEDQGLGVLKVRRRFEFNLTSIAPNSRVIFTPAPDEGGMSST